MSIWLNLPDKYEEISILFLSETFFGYRIKVVGPTVPVETESEIESPTTFSFEDNQQLDGNIKVFGTEYGDLANDSHNSSPVSSMPSAEVQNAEAEKNKDAAAEKAPENFVGTKSKPQSEGTPEESYSDTPSKPPILMVETENVIDLPFTKTNEVKVNIYFERY